MLPDGGFAAGSSRRAIGALACAILCACEGAPARSKPWRHPREVESTQTAPQSKVLTQEAERVSARRERDRTVRIHIDADPVHLHPMLSPTMWGRRIVSGPVFETLLTFRPADDSGERGHYDPGLARRWTISGGGREIRIDLQPEVSFHDGQRLSSVDVQFSIDAARSPRYDAPHLRAALGDVIAVELITARSLRLRLSRPNGYVLRALAEIPILSAPAYANRRRAGDGPVIGTGPYRVASQEGDTIRLEAFAGYWGKRPALDAIVFVFDPDDARALTAAKNGELDVIPALAPIHYPKQAEAPGVATRFRPLRLRPPTLRYLVLNTARAPFDDVRVRQAVSLAIDRRQLVDRAHRKLAWAPAGPVWPGGPILGPSRPAPERDRPRAGSLLDAADWRDANRDGVRERATHRLMITVLATAEPSPERDAVLEALRQTGFVVDVRTGSPAVLNNRLASHDFDLAFVEWSGEVDRDPGPLFATGGSRNWGSFSDQDVDRLIDAMRAAIEPDERAPLARELAQRLDATQPIVPLTAPDPYGLVSARVTRQSAWDGWISVRDLALTPAAP